VNWNKRGVGRILSILLVYEKEGKKRRKEGQQVGADQQTGRQKKGVKKNREKKGAYTSVALTPERTIPLLAEGRGGEKGKEDYLRQGGGGGKPSNGPLGPSRYKGGGERKKKDFSFQKKKKGQKTGGGKKGHSPFV